MKLVINNLSHRYDVEVLKDLSIHLTNYNCIAIIGVSGSGKSTLIRIMSGLEKPTSGSVIINDLDVFSNEHKKQVGFVFQHHNLFPHLSLIRNITLILEKTRGYTKKEAYDIAYDNLVKLHLKDQINKLPKNVSGGQAQRASIARALSINPKIIFLDEPTSALDPILTDEVLSAIEELRDIGKDFIFVTHVMSFVRDFADYVLFMDQGKIVEHGLPTILNNPKTSELKAFMAKVR
ncbi:MAG: ATP-binding cassette domain-containing protein [Acholeplasmataceae bacterium]|nr:ATP-binding cassette domain-containing protein [Acholeplasmataceae bacterium]